MSAPPGLSARKPHGLAGEPASPPRGATERSHANGLDATVAVLVLAQSRPGAVAWGWSRVVLGRLALRGVEGLRFARALGSGRDGGFGVAPSHDRHGLFALFDDDAAADAFLDRSDTLAGYRDHSRELLVAKLRATSSRGSWGGASMAATLPSDPHAPIAALTRASIRPHHAIAFWRHTPASQATLATAPGCRLAVGLGEAPLLRQATFSVWDNAAAMDAYARHGAHLEAIRASRHTQYFSESMFVRLRPLRLQGVWKGRSHG